MTVHLSVRSSFTLLESTIRISALVAKAKEYGYQYAALTDHHVMFGAAYFIHACHKEGIRPIIGLEADCLYHDEVVPFLLLAKDSIGYRNLIRLSTKLCSGARYCTFEELCSASFHCFLIAYGEGGWIDSELVSMDTEGVIRKLTTMKEELPVFDVALSYQEASLWRDRNAMLRRICSNMNIRTLALNKVCYLNPEDASDFRLLSAIRTGRTVDDPSLPLIKGRSFLSPAEMEKLYEAQDLLRTDEIARECRGDYITQKAGLPAYKTKNNVPPEDYFPALCVAGLKKRLNNVPDQAYIDRLKYELEVIRKMHFENYFLIVYDFISYARKQKIYVGPGRGSAAGSLAAYCLGITQVDPMKYNLLFERFLNPERVSMPDIDTDIPDNRRQEVIDYVVRTYGEDRVAGIIAFGTFGARQALRDTGKAMGMTSREIDMIAKLVPSAPKITLEAAYASTPRLRQLIESNDKYHTLYEYARHIEGLPRHATTHAAGIVMSSVPLEEVIPAAKFADGLRTTQFTMEFLEERGLIKMDFLGLRNLTIIDEIATEIQQDEPAFRIMDIPLDEPRAYEIFANADTTGVFQFESEGMKNLLRRMKPQTFADVIAALALFRPASADSIPAYIQNKNNPSEIVYPLESLKPVLSETYGVMIYQEQAMRTAQIAAGFSLARADVLRKAMSKKKEKEIAALQNEFMEGCRKNNVDQETSVHLWELVSAFGGYGFNKSHAVAYGLVAYQTAYLKGKYPLQFYKALLNSVTGDEYRTSQYIDECRRKGITVLSPDINASSLQYQIDDKALRLPLSVIKQVGGHAASVIIDERENNGLYEDYYDFVARALLRRLSRTVIEQLIDAGALDCLQMGRRTMKANLDEAISYGELIQVGSGSQMSIDLDLVSKPVPVRMKDDREEMSENERRALGFNLGTQLIVMIRENNGITDPSIARICASTGKTTGFAQIRSVKQHRTKRGEMMAFLRLGDETGEIDMAVMPNLYKKTAANLLRGTYIRFNAKIEDGSLLADSITVIPKK